MENNSTKNDLLYTHFFTNISGYQQNQARNIDKSVVPY